MPSVHRPRRHTYRTVHPTTIRNGKRTHGTAFARCSWVMRDHRPLRMLRIMCTPCDCKLATAAAAPMSIRAEDLLGPRPPCAAVGPGA